MDPIYLDHAATTPVRPEVREAMARAEAERFGNPSSPHRWGRSARAALEESRERVAAALGAERGEIVFTGSGTEADNVAVLGGWRAAAQGGARRHGENGGDPGYAAGAMFVCSAIEHKAVIAAAKTATREGATLMVVGVDEEGRVPLGAIDEALAAEPRPVLVSVMWGNNEVGTLQPIAEIGARCRAAGVRFHTDAVQAFGRVAVHVDDASCDLLTLSAHKIGGPRGIGALYVRTGVDLQPLTYGGGQEGGLRPGTPDVTAAVGFAAAAELAVAELGAEAERLASLRDRLEASLRDAVPGLTVNACGAERLPHILNVSVADVEQEDILVMLDFEGIGVSSGSACQTGAVERSHVLTAMGQSESAGASVRFSLGYTTAMEEIDRAADGVARVTQRLRSLAAR